MSTTTVTHSYRFGCCGAGAENHPAQVFTARHFHIYDWNTRVVFKCVQETLLEAGKHSGGVRWVRSERAKCSMRRKLES
jgi:hypothetical protein